MKVRAKKPLGSKHGKTSKAFLLSILTPALTIAQLEDLGEALLDFASVTDLEAWLAQGSKDRGEHCK